MAAWTSSNVAGAPPPAPTRRYSMFQAVHPFWANERASGRPRSRSYSAFQNPPWMTTTTPLLGVDGRVSSPNWLESSP